MEFNSFNKIITLVILHSFFTPILSLSFPALGALRDPSLQTTAQGLPRWPMQWLISCVNLVGPGGAQIVAQTLFWVCLLGAWGMKLTFELKD